MKPGNMTVIIVLERVIEPSGKAYVRKKIVSDQ
jgi:hypothetical protein